MACDTELRRRYEAGFVPAFTVVALMKRNADERSGTGPIFEIPLVRHLSVTFRNRLRVSLAHKSGMAEIERSVYWDFNLQITGHEMSSG